jgi:hypothetical protein
VFDGQDVDLKGYSITSNPYFDFVPHIKFPRWRESGHLVQSMELSLLSINRFVIKLFKLFLRLSIVEVI